MAIKQLFSGVQAIHSNNNTFVTREGYVSEWDLDEMTPLIYPGDNNSYTNLVPGMYKITIGEDIYVFVLHTTLSGIDKLVIHNQYNAYTIIRTKKERIILYKAHSGKIIETNGHVMNHTVNDYLDLLVMDGITKFTTDGTVSLSHPGKLEFISMINIKVTDENNNYEEYLFNMKAYLKGLNKIHDTLYIDAANNKALFRFKLGRMVFTGSEPIIKIDEYSTDTVGVYFYANPLVKPEGDVVCTHLPVITWDNMIDTSYTKNGICAGLESNKGFYFKIRRTDCDDLEAFKNVIIKWNTITTEELNNIRNAEYSEAVANSSNPKSVRKRAAINTQFTITYELYKEQFKHLALDNYKIKTFFNKSWIICTPYKNPSIYYIRQTFDTIIGLVPKNGVMKSILEQMKESGNSDCYEKILSENKVIGDISPRETKQIDYLQSMDDNSTVAVSDQNLQGSEMPIDENSIWRDLIITGDINIRTMYFYKHLRLTHK